MDYQFLEIRSDSLSLIRLSRWSRNRGTINRNIWQPFRRRLRDRKQYSVLRLIADD